SLPARTLRSPPALTVEARADTSLPASSATLPPPLICVPISLLHEGLGGGGGLLGDSQQRSRQRSGCQ
ncbi:hypothetical protein, partial [Variovorax fucosicus]|uniref:hypothetical protein n=1 Tax=Variovorax fucosicus TaxID=3053517 RepID=UPI002575B6FA